MFELKINKISRERGTIEKYDTNFLNNKAEHSISNISMENSKNQIFNNDINKKGNLFKTLETNEKNKKNDFYLTNNYLENKIVLKDKKVL